MLIPMPNLTLVDAWESTLILSDLFSENNLFVYPPGVMLKVSLAFIFFIVKGSGTITPIL
jgi:hypothetical protein